MNNTERIAAWTKALRSGAFEQGCGYLNNNGKFCCLGVACEIFKNEIDLKIADSTSTPGVGLITYDRHKSDLPEKVKDYLGIQTGLGSFYAGSLAVMNDQGSTFEEIADVIESRPKGLFT